VLLEFCEERRGPGTDPNVVCRWRVFKESLNDAKQWLRKFGEEL
jgi:hypothetical protein